MLRSIGSKVILGILVILALILYFVSAKRIDNRLKIAYTEDLAGILIKNVEEKANLSRIGNSFEYLNIGDCCGSQAQFILANNKVDIVVMCPDAVEYLNDIKNDYVELGVLLYDSDVLITDKELANVNLVGYMNKRNQQGHALTAYFGDGISIAPMFPSALPYALSSGKIDAALVDINNYLSLNYEGVNITNDLPTQVIVVKKDLLNDKRLESFINIYNDEIDKISSNVDYIVAIIEKNLNLEGLKEKWLKTKVKFGRLQK